MCGVISTLLTFPFTCLPSPFPGFVAISLAISSGFFFTDNLQVLERTLCLKFKKLVSTTEIVFVISV